MEHSLLKVKPELLVSRGRKLAKSLANTLYSQLDRASECNFNGKGPKVRVFDGQLQRDYLVTKYERTKVKFNSMGKVIKKCFYFCLGGIDGKSVA